MFAPTIEPTQRKLIRVPLINHNTSHVLCLPHKTRKTSTSKLIKTHMIYHICRPREYSNNPALKLTQPLLNCLFIFGFIASLAKIALILAHKQTASATNRANINEKFYFWKTRFSHANLKRKRLRRSTGFLWWNFHLFWCRFCMQMNLILDRSLLTQFLRSQSRRIF